jgi:thiol:disulfide interchange protein
MMSNNTPTAVVVFAAALAFGGCSSSKPEATKPETAPPPAIRAWMDRLTVAHEYDPKTGFIVARETVTLPPVIANAPPLDEAIARAGSERVVVAFATADRCAPCQQYKRDALNDAAVIARLSDPGLLPTHVEVDRSPQLAKDHLGTTMIPMTYALRGGKVIASLRGQRSAAELLAWLDGLP